MLEVLCVVGDSADGPAFFINFSIYSFIYFFNLKNIMYQSVQSVMLGTNRMPLISKNQSGLVKVPVNFKVY